MPETFSGRKAAPRRRRALPQHFKAVLTEGDASTTDYMVATMVGRVPAGPAGEPYRRAQALLAEASARVRWNYVCDGCRESGPVSLGSFPFLADLSDTAAVAVYIALLSERGDIKLAQTRWPDNLQSGDFDALDEPVAARDPADLWAASAHFLHPRYYRHVAAPFEWPTGAPPLGLPIELRCCRSPWSWGDIHPRTKVTYHLTERWDGDEGSNAPLGVWPALALVEQHLGRFSRRVEADAFSDKERSLCDVEVFPCVSARGHAALWLAMLRDEGLILKGRSPTWPTPNASDLAIFAVFGDPRTEALSNKYLEPLVYPPEKAKKTQKIAKLSRSRGAK